MNPLLTFINIVGDSKIILKNLWQHGTFCLWRILFISKQVVPRVSLARPDYEIARLQYNDIATPGAGRVRTSLPRLLFMRFYNA